MQTEKQTKKNWSDLSFFIFRVFNLFNLLSLFSFFTEQKDWCENSSHRPCRANAPLWSPLGCAACLWPQQHAVQCRTPPQRPALGLPAKTLGNWTPFSGWWCRPSSPCSALCCFWEQVTGAWEKRLWNHQLLCAADSAFFVWITYSISESLCCRD